MKLSLGNVEFLAGQAMPLAATNDDGPDNLALEDQLLVARIGTGDAEAFATIVRKHTPSLYRVACRMLSDRCEAEDVVQEAFSRLWHGAKAWTSKGAGLVGWLHRVTMNLCFDRLRQPRPVVMDVVPDVADSGPLPDQSIHEQELTASIEIAMASLSDRHRAAIVLTYLESLPNAMAASVMDMNIKAFESLLSRARGKLREALERQQVESRDLEVLA